MFGFGAKSQLVDAGSALPGRSGELPGVPSHHAVLGTPIRSPWPDGAAELYLGMGCFWGAEKLMWNLPGVFTTAAGYMGGFTPNPTYEEVCSGRTGHTETVMVVFDPTVLPLTDLLAAFWENHDPTQGMRQGNDLGTQYRSAVYATTEEHQAAVEHSAQAFQRALNQRGFGAITTELRPASAVGPFYYAEGYHQQYLHKNPGGYCPVHATGVTCG